MLEDSWAMSSLVIDRTRYFFEGGHNNSHKTQNSQEDISHPNVKNSFGGKKIKKNIPTSGQTVSSVLNRLYHIPICTRDGTRISHSKSLESTFLK